MRINKLNINNFRIYFGNNEIILRKGSLERNISIIAGYNGFGKTTFLNALVWCFYGKLIAEVDEKYRKEIYEAGGYRKYCALNLNREIRNNSQLEQSYKVEVELSDIYIPTVPCNQITILREYDLVKESEKVNILIDGSENELTKDVGTDIFINDFILPKEIAKFFFFDAEKIVSLSEIRTINEKKDLSRAYSEVLGISKYESLKKNLENLRVKLRKRSASIEQRNKLEKLQVEINELKKCVNSTNNKIYDITLELENNKNLSDHYQEKLIREGNKISVDDLISLKKAKDKLKEDSQEIKLKLKDLFELVPFAIAGQKTKDLFLKIQKESEHKQIIIDSEFLDKKLSDIRSNLILKIQNLEYSKSVKTKLNELVINVFDSNHIVRSKSKEKVLLDLSDKEQNEFFALYDNLKHSFKIIFSQILKEEKNNRSFLSKTTRKISLAESQESNELIKKYKIDKEQIDKKIQFLNSELTKLYEYSGGLQHNITSESRLASELSKTVNLDELDSKKDIVVERLLLELNEFLYRFKLDRKQSLESRVKNELNILMHKEDFIVDVRVELSDELIDIHLFDKNGKIIEKETLSKGEQQLYATALLKALVDESEINFPIFIDSPLQKFDKKHSNNIILSFYPSISKQVIIFPLLEKELTEREYELLLPHVNQVFLIKNAGERSEIIENHLDTLFNQFELESNVYSHKNISE